MTLTRSRNPAELAAFTCSYGEGGQSFSRTGGEGEGKEGLEQEAAGVVHSMAIKEKAGERGRQRGVESSKHEEAREASAGGAEQQMSSKPQR